MTLQDEPVIFANALEGLYRSFGDRFDAQALASMKELGVDFAAPMPAYPLYTCEEVIKLMAKALYPSTPEPDRWEQMGQEWLQGYLHTMLGRAALVVGRTVGLRRALERMPRNFKTASNYLSASALVHGPNDVELRTYIEEPYLRFCANKPSVMLHYRAGILRQAVAEFRVRDASVAIESWDPALQSARYRIRWEA